MPGKDKTGPEGKGPMTGRQMGICEGANPIGRGFGPGCGRGLRRGFGRGFNRTGFGEPVEFSKDQQIKILEADKAEIEAELEGIKKKLSEIKK